MGAQLQVRLARYNTRLPPVCEAVNTFRCEGGLIAAVFYCRWGDDEAANRMSRGVVRQMPEIEE